MANKRNQVNLWELPRKTGHKLWAWKLWKVSKTKKITQSVALDFGANDKKDPTMCFPWIKLAWLQYIIIAFFNYLSEAEVLEKEAFSVTGATQTRKRKKKARHYHTCKRPIKGHSKIKDCPRNMAKQAWIRTVFFYPRLQLFILFSLINLIWLYTC